MNQLEKGTFPSPGMTYPVRPASNPPARELHVKVWEPQPPVPSQGELEQIETRPLVSQPQARSVSSPPVRGVQEGARTADAGGSRRGSNRAPTGREMASHTGAGGSRPAPTGLYSQPAVDVKQAPPASVSVRRVTQARKKSRGPLIFISVLFLLVVVAGLTAWVIVFSPFSVPGVTSVDLPFQDTTLGIALRYPQGWTARADSKHEAAYFYDSSHTGQVTILTAPANGSGAEQYIRKVAAQQGMTGQSSQPALSFAGAVWEQLKGSVILSGATYSETLLVTEHAHRFYTIEQLAPSSVYNDEERLVFARLRSSFSFLS